MRTHSSCRPGRFRSLWTVVAQAGQAYWFFGNLYEAMVDMPQLLVDARPHRTPGLLASGSPVRYYAPAAPLTFAATVIALVDSWRSGGDRRVIVAATASTASAVALSGYLIRTVSARLLRTGELLNAAERRKLVRTWHRANLARLVALGVASVALRQSAMSAGLATGREIQERRLL